MADLLDTIREKVDGQIVSSKRCSQHGITELFAVNLRLSSMILDSKTASSCTGLRHSLKQHRISKGRD